MTETLKHMLMGAVGGAVIVMIGGFYGLGWTLGSTAEEMANDRADTAVAQALVPVCTTQALANPAALNELGNTTSTYRRARIVQDAGWAVMPGTDDVHNRDLARACAEALADRQSD